MVRYVTIFVVPLLLAVLIGCSGFDSTQVLIHPETAGPSATIDVALVNLYTYIDTAGSVISKDITRDSLHLLVGMPESWEVTEAKMAVVNDMSTEQLLALQSSLVDKQAIAELLAQYQTSATALTADDALAGALAGKTVNAHNEAADGEVPVVIDDVEQVKGFGAPVNITIAAGSEADTAPALDSMLAFVAGTGLVPDSTMTTVNSLLTLPGLKKPDSLGIVMVPVIVFLKIKVGSQEGDDTLFYFTKTGAMDQTPSSILTTIATLKPEMKPLLTGIESGDMVFAPITVTGTAGISAQRNGEAFSEVMVAADRVSGNVRIDLGSAGFNPPAVSIYSLQGNLIASLASQSSRNIVWAGTDLHGNRVPAGMYLVRVAGVNGCAVRGVQLMR